MKRSLAIVAVLCFFSVGRADPPVPIEVPGSFPIPRPSHNVKDWGPLDYDDTPGAVPGGIVFIKQGDQRIWRFGGALFPMHVRVSEPGPDGRITNWMTLPSSGQSMRCRWHFSTRPGRRRGWRIAPVCRWRCPIHRESCTSMAG